MPRSVKSFKPIADPVAVMRHNIAVWRELGEPESWIRCRVPRDMWAELGLGNPYEGLGNVPKVAVNNRKSKCGLTTNQVAAKARAIIEEALDQEIFLSYTHICRAAGAADSWLMNSVSKKLPWALELAALADKLCQYGDPSDYRGNQCPRNLREYWADKRKAS